MIATAQPAESDSRSMTGVVVLSMTVDICVHVKLLMAEAPSVKEAHERGMNRGKTGGDLL